MLRIQTVLVAGLWVAAIPWLAIPPAAAVAQSASPAINMDVALAERSLGDPAAPVTIFAYESFSCGHCAAFHAQVYDELKTRYIDTGKVRFIYRDYPLNLPAEIASRIARCAAPDLFFGLAGILFRDQESWARANNPVFELGRIGRLAGMDTDRMELCVNSIDLADGIEAIKAGGKLEYGVKTTPTFVIAGIAHEGEQSIDQFAAILDPLIAAAQ
ncbi:MAG: DsbA family protein [Alphaproteobacteria bacterium]|nr:DsbA family protein [Alphaproteobacteria bacterium]